MALTQEATGWVCTICGRFYTNTEYEKRNEKPPAKEFDTGEAVTTPAAICSKGLCNVVKIDE